VFELIENWRSAHKFSSMQLNAFAVFCDAAFVLVASIDESWPINPAIYAGVRTLLTLAAMVARMVKQDGVSGE